MVYIIYQAYLALWKAEISWSWPQLLHSKQLYPDSLFILFQNEVPLHSEMGFAHCYFTFTFTVQNSMFDLQRGESFSVLKSAFKMRFCGHSLETNYDPI